MANLVRHPVFRYCLRIDAKARCTLAPLEKCIEPAIPVTKSRELLSTTELPALNLKPSFNLAAFVNKSESLQQLIKLGVDLNKLEKKPKIAELILGLDFDQQIKPRILFLHDCGLTADYLGKYLTKNAAILAEPLEDLEVRINFLQSKRFTPDHITRIVTKNPFWLMFPTQTIDMRLGYFQRSFSLTGSETRSVAVSQPRLITYSMEHIRQSTFTVAEEMGFKGLSLKKLLLTVPRLWLLDPKQTVEKFEYLHNQMGIQQEQLLKDAPVFMSRRFRIEQRDKFLRYLGKAQYDPTKDLYISLTQLVSGSDADFAWNVAKCNLDTYETFLKTL